MQFIIQLAFLLLFYGLVFLYVLYIVGRKGTVVLHGKSVFLDSILTTLVVELEEVELEAVVVEILEVEEEMEAAVGEEMVEDADLEIQYEKDMTVKTKNC